MWKSDPSWIPARWRGSCMPWLTPYLKWLFVVFAFSKIIELIKSLSLTEIRMWKSDPSRIPSRWRVFCVLWLTPYLKRLSVVFALSKRIEVIKSLSLVDVRIWKSDPSQIPVWWRDSCVPWLTLYLKWIFVVFSLSKRIEVITRIFFPFIIWKEHNDKLERIAWSLMNGNSADIFSPLWVINHCERIIIFMLISVKKWHNQYILAHKRKGL